MTAIAPPPTFDGQLEPDPVVAAADRALARAGAARLRHGDVATAAGVDVRTVRARFPDVLALVTAVLRYRQEHWLHGLAMATRAVSEPRDQILALFGYLELCFTDDDWRGCAFINGYGELGRTEPSIAALADEHLASIEAHLRTLCTEASLPSYVADGLSLLVQGAKVEAAIHGTTQPARSARMTAAVLMSVYGPARADRFI
ncbi:TetR/AcrR family transcriptional regulator [Curtobacterium pusillum]|uniref:TetR/AcrR family transcriptional regulator n=1 Tax=Curtobacterium pusillum TaxID=69373 RepID=UPI00119F2B26|nr:TetR/AcrR family transcriptional regulator [Curtobacterium pusillum]